MLPLLCVCVNVCACACVSMCVTMKNNAHKYAGVLRWEVNIGYPSPLLSAVFCVCCWGLGLGSSLLLSKHFSDVAIFQTLVLLLLFFPLLHSGIGEMQVLSWFTLYPGCNISVFFLYLLSSDYNTKNRILCGGCCHRKNKKKITNLKKASKDHQPKIRYTKLQRHFLFYIIKREIQKESTELE